MHTATCRRQETLFIPFPALNDTDCFVFIPSINQSILPPIHWLLHSVSSSHLLINVWFSPPGILIDMRKALCCSEPVIALPMGWVNYSECKTCTSFLNEAGLIKSSPACLYKWLSNVLVCVIWSCHLLSLYLSGSAAAISCSSPVYPLKAFSIFMCLISLAYQPLSPHIIAEYVCWKPSL